jgi:hypothetical protein
MKRYLHLVTAAALTVLPAIAFAQADSHHSGAPEQPSAASPQTPPPGMSAEQGGAMMQMMQQMMPMMQQMMGMMQGAGPAGQMGGMQQGGMMGHDMAGAAMPGMSDASKAYMDAMKKMDAPMMEALQSPDPDVAFIAGMIPHHQGAIDMARAVLNYGKDEKVKAWAEQIIKAQEAEIAEMQAWLKEHQQ